MRWRLMILAILGVILLLPATALGQDVQVDSDDNSFIFRANGDTVIAKDEVVENAFVANGNLTMDGTVKNTLVVVRGDAVVSGAVGDSIAVLDGDLTLLAGATVKDVSVIGGSLDDQGATITGKTDVRSNLDVSLGRGFAVFGTLFFIGLAILGAAAAAIFAWLGRDQLYGSIDTLRNHLVPSIVTALILWIVLPIVAGLIVATIIGIPLGLSIFLTLLPILWLLGAIIIGTWIVSRFLKPTSRARAIVAAVLGALLIALVSLIPFVAVITALAGMLGSGALVYRMFKHAQGHDAPAVTAATMPEVMTDRAALG